MGDQFCQCPGFPTHPRPTGHLWVIPVINDMGLALFLRGGVPRGRRPGKERLTPQRAKDSDCCGPPSRPEHLGETRLPYVELISSISLSLAASYD